MKKILSIILASVSICGWAQEVSQSRVLDEVVVQGAAKSTQTIEQQGVSVTLLDSAFISNNNVRGLQDLSQYVPSLEIPQYGSRLTSSMYVRGIGSRINSPSVGVYYENIPLLFKSALNRHYYDVDKVAVLRGPQGTLYGLNSEGGLIILESSNPIDVARSGAPRYKIHAGIENHGGRVIEGSATLPMSAFFPHLSYSWLDRMAVSVQAFYHGTNGYLWNPHISQRADKLEEGGAKLKLAWDPNDKLRLSLFGDVQRVSQRGFAYGLTGMKPETTDICPDSVNSPASNIPGSFYRTTVDAGFNLIYNIGKWRLESTTSFQYLKSDMEMDQDYTLSKLMHLTQREIGKSVTEELNFKGKVGKVWKLSQGVYFAHQWLDTSAPVYFDEDFTANISSVVKQVMSASLPPQQAALLQVSTDMSVPGDYRTPMLNLGVYHESNFEITKDFSITAGVRYDYNRQNLDYYASSLTNLNVAIATVKMERKILSELSNNLSHSYNQVLPKLSLRFKDWYFTVAKGYRAGGFNIQMFSDILQGEFNKNLPTIMAKVREGDIVFPHDEASYREVEDRISYDPEYSWNYEIGGKSTIKLRPSNVRPSLLNLRYAVFYTKVNDLQLSVMADSYGYGRMMKNAGKSTSCGGELSLDGYLALTSAPNPRYANSSVLKDPALLWTAAYSYTHTKFLDDKRVPFIPNHTVSASLG